MSRSQWTKQVVDNHVSNILKQQKDEKQVAMLGVILRFGCHVYIDFHVFRWVGIISGTAERN